MSQMYYFYDAAGNYVGCGASEADTPDGCVATTAPPPVPAKTDTEIISELTADLEAHYDSIAQTERYDNRMTCALRAGYAGPFQAQGQSFAIWMDTCNAYVYTVMADCSAGTRDIPTGDELIAELPVSPW